MFVDEGTNKTIALSAIATAKWHHNDGLPQLILHDRNGGYLGTVSVTIFEDAVKRTLPLIQAQPGTYLVQYYCDEDGETIFRDVVLAWRAGEYGGLEPVTLQCINPTEYGVLLPDGRVVIPDDADFETLDEFQKTMSARRAKENERQAQQKEGAA